MKRISKPKKQALAAKEFALQWENRGNEKSDTQHFWTDLLQKVLLVSDPHSYIEFEKPVRFKNQQSIDGYIFSTRVLIEQKSFGVKLDVPLPQSDGAKLTAYQQARRYISGLSNLENPRYIITCNFSEIWVYDNRSNPNSEPEKIQLKDLEKEYHRLNFLVDEEAVPLHQEKVISIEAGDIVEAIYDKLHEQYIEKDSAETLQSLNKLCVRLVFCLYAEDAGLFGSHTAFYDYLDSFKNISHWRKAIIDLFHVLNTPYDKRDEYDEELNAFPYVNGGLFSDENIIIPQFTEELRILILEKASAGFDWSKISPTIFGAVFESTIDAKERKEGGMHYTSVENIHKVIDPLFLNRLWKEFYDIIGKREEKLSNDIDIYRTNKEKLRKLNQNQVKQLDTLQNKIAGLKFLDPACGSGNFLTETYISLRRLENEIIRKLYDSNMFVGWINNPVKVGIHQFYGMEVNDFAVSVAKTALWIAEHQMLKETEKIASFDIDPLPLKSYDNIKKCNALRTDWSSIVPVNVLNYFMGNPPFYGARKMTQEQKADLKYVFGDDWNGVGDLDYVAGWYKIATELMAQHPQIKTALVSTNSITQGEQVALLWQPLMDNYKLHIDFAHRTFRWDNQAKKEAKVHCVIIGCSIGKKDDTLEIYDGKKIIQAEHINPYLSNAPDVWIINHRKPLSKVPEIGIGNKPIDDGNYIFTKEEMDAFICKEPLSKNYFHPYYGAVEFINQKPRYCLWLGFCDPNELIRMPNCLKRVKLVREFRLSSKSKGTRKLADTPTRFHVENMPHGNYILVPCHTSENRNYIPMGFMSDKDICSNAVLLIPNAQLYHFGILQSWIHMTWMKTICGRIKSDYRYSKEIVYNNFPWPKPTAEQKNKIEETAQAILDARAEYSDSNLDALYNVNTMPAKLLKAHKANDKAVLAAYGLSPNTSESEMVAELFILYKKLTKRK